MENNEEKTEKTTTTETKVEKTRKPLPVKKIVFNVIIAAICIASILTLYLGDFMNTDIKLTVTKDTIKGWISNDAKAAGGESGGIKMSGPEETEKKKSLFSGDMTEDEMIDMILGYVPDDFSLEFNLKLSVNGQTLAKSAAGQKEEAVKELIEKQVDSVVSEVDTKVEELIVVAKEVIADIIQDSTEDLKAMVREEIQKALAENDLTVEELDDYLDKLGDDLTMAEIDTLIDYVADEPIKAILDGDAKAARDGVMNHATTKKILRTIAKLEVLSEKGSDLENATKAEIAAFFAVPENGKAVDDKVKEAEDEINKVYDEYVPKLADENGKITSESLITGLMNLINEASEGEAKASNAAEGESALGQISSLDDVKQLIVDKINEMLDAETMKMIGNVMSYFGYFLFFVMACWAYVLLKLIIKTIFCKRKTVGLFFARFFGWMPHVFFVGLPMLVILNKDVLFDALAQNGMDIGSEITPYLDMISININSLTWISALGTVLLLVILFFYYPMRRQEKRERKAQRRGNK